MAQLNRYRCILIISWKKPLRRNWFVDAFYQLICISNSYLSNSLFRHHDHMFTGILFTQIILYQGIWLAKKLFWLSCTSSYSYMIKIAHYSLGERCSRYSVIIVINHKFFRLFYVHIEKTNIGKCPSLNYVSPFNFCLAHIFLDTIKNVLAS